jgi:hypothetical protein
VGPACPASSAACWAHRVVLCGARNRMHALTAVALQVDIFSLAVIMYELFIMCPLHAKVSKFGTPEELETYAKRVAILDHRESLKPAWPPSLKVRRSPLHSPVCPFSMRAHWPIPSLSEHTSLSQSVRGRCIKVRLDCGPAP